MARVTTLHHQLEVTGDCATLYLSGALSANDHDILTEACGALPAGVGTLRLDLHGVDDVDDDALVTIRALLRYWRESRGGSFRLSLASERIVATYSEGRLAHGSLGLRSALPHVVETAPCLTGMYL